MRVKIILVDDHKIMREGLRSMLEKHPDIAVVAEAENGREVLKLVENLKPDLVIMDITMPDLNGIEATKQITTQSPDVKVIALSMHSDKKFVREMLKAGAKGYLLKDTAFEELEKAIQSVINNQTYLSSKIVGTVVEDYLGHNGIKKSFEPPSLTKREREVLQLFAEGKTTKEIAAMLYVSIKTVETHRKAIMDKLNLHSIAELTKFAVREGLTSLEE